jgi:hypothetical protein
MHVLLVVPVHRLPDVPAVGLAIAVVHAHVASEEQQGVSLAGGGAQQGAQMVVLGRLEHWHCQVLRGQWAVVWVCGMAWRGVAWRGVVLYCVVLCCGVVWCVGGLAHTGKQSGDTQVQSHASILMMPHQAVSQCPRTSVYHSNTMPSVITEQPPSNP